jgi:hypothetical protein
MQLEEIGGKNVAELQGIGGDGGIGQRFASGGENGLKTAANPATYRGGESSQEGLVFVHTYTNSNTGFLTTFFAEKCLKSVPFGSDP